MNKSQWLSFLVLLDNSDNGYTELGVAHVRPISRAQALDWVLSSFSS